MSLSDGVIVALLASLSPLYSLVLSAVFLRDVEEVDPNGIENRRTKSRPPRPPELEDVLNRTLAA